ncbi:MAG: 16S rRNA (uracil(1498)-N(3))-methyltransferase [Firmicutes bacterium]|nr:16S rRNA (uracil(1498)-N(3))-methyltransferase [Bacillota bacterium]
MRRIFLNKIDSKYVELTGEQHIHLSVSKRARVGDKVEIAAGGYIYSAVVFVINKNSTTLEIVDKIEKKLEPNIEIVLYFARQKPEHAEITVQKCVELGITKLVPVKTKFICLQQSKIDRLNKIAFSAAAQSGRGFVPKVEEEIDFEKALDEIKYYDFCIFAYENAENTSLRGFLKGKLDKKVAIFVGSEGGFSNEEVKIAVNAGLIPVSLGKRILRAETACIAVLSCLMYEMGELGV